jgi:glycosyltransferase involved in cell wall biosynthesis
MTIKTSLVVSTLGRSSELETLFASLDRQEFCDFEVIVVDQNADDRLTPVLARPRAYPVRHVRTPTDRGLSRGRNVGWRVAQGEYVLFPDDDCWYPVDLLSRAMADADATGVDMLCGRATDEAGRNINGRFSGDAQWVTRRHVWTTQIEWMMFFRRDALERLGGFDERLGVGSSSRWQAAEGQDISLRALACGLRCFYDPALRGHHAEIDLGRPDAAMIRKGHGYALGMGFVLGKAGYGAGAAAYWTSRAMFNAARAAIGCNPERTRYFASQAHGRMAGWLDGRAQRGAASASSPPGGAQTA